MNFDYNKVTIGDQIEMLAATEAYKNDGIASIWFSIVIAVANKCTTIDIFDLPASQTDNIVQMFSQGLAVHLGVSAPQVFIDEIENIETLGSDNG